MTFGVRVRAKVRLMVVASYIAHKVLVRIMHLIQPVHPKMSRYCRFAWCEVLCMV